MTVIQEGGVKFYIDENLKNQLDKVKTRVQTKDEDYFFAVDGEEGSGKSVLTMQLARYLDPSFTIDRMVFTAKDFQDAIMKADKFQAIVFDESFRGLSSRGALTDVNKLLVLLMMECRQKNLFVFVVMPSFYLLDKYVALWRAKGLFHVYRNKGKRGFWVYFNKKKKMLLYLKGKQTYSYAFPKSSFKGRFLDNYVIDEAQYREKKRLALMNAPSTTRNEHLGKQRDILLFVLHKIVGWSLEDISFRFKEYGETLTKSAISKRVAEIEEKQE